MSSTVNAVPAANANPATITASEPNSLAEGAMDGVPVDQRDLATASETTGDSREVLVEGAGLVGDGAEAVVAVAIASCEGEAATSSPDGTAIQLGGDTVLAQPAPLPDPDVISARLTRLVVFVADIEELSRKAREAATSDLARYDGVLASQRQFEQGRDEAIRIREQAQSLFDSAFGHAARAAAEPALLEARDVEQAFADLADSWRRHADAFLLGHPDVAVLLDERRQQEREARRREAQAAATRRLDEIVAGGDAALRLGLLDEANAYLTLLRREFSSESARIKSLQNRIDDRVRAHKDAAARAALAVASEHQGRGDVDAAVKTLEAVDVHGLTKEVSEDLFGRWSDACSRLAQTGGLDLVRFAPAQGRGLILTTDPAVPNGLVVFSSLGMGPNYPEGKIMVDPLVLNRARRFRQAAPVAQIGGWQSYVTPSAGGSVQRH